MADTKIENNGASIKITIGTKTRNVIKTTIQDVVIDNSILKIDIGRGPLGNIFIPLSDITTPAPSDGDLQTAIMAMLAPLNTSSATEARQIEQIDILNTLKSSLSSLQGLVTDLDKKIFHDPLLVDDSGAGIIYNGYALVGADQTAAQWAIERIVRKDDIDVHSWANGNKDFDNTWVNRESLVYL